MAAKQCLRTRPSIRMDSAVKRSDERRHAERLVECINLLDQVSQLFQRLFRALRWLADYAVDMHRRVDHSNKRDETSSEECRVRHHLRALSKTIFDDLGIQLVSLKEDRGKLKGGLRVFATVQERVFEDWQRAVYTSSLIIQPCILELGISCLRWTSYWCEAMTVGSMRGCEGCFSPVALGLWPIRRIPHIAYHISHTLTPDRPQPPFSHPIFSCSQDPPKILLSLEYAPTYSVVPST